MNSGYLEQLVLEDTQSVFKVKIDSVLLSSSCDADLADMIVQSKRLYHVLVDSGG